MSESAWKFGAYRRGMGVEGDDPRVIYAVSAIKRELVWHGYDLSLETTRFGPKTADAVAAFQITNGLPADGMVGPLTANALWRRRIIAEDIPYGWLRAQIHWESGDDPGAMYTNEDGSRDRGLIQLNSRNQEDDALAFDPAWSVPFLASFLRREARERRTCRVPRYRLAVGAWRTPVGADEWCNDPDLEPDQDGSWGQKAAFYVGRVDTYGRWGWVDGQHAPTA
jgi:putative peptidoglycan binding protein